MDLTKTHPRGPYEELGGLPWLPRMIDKARAVAAGTPGDYEYPCVMDRALLEFLGIEADALLDRVRAGLDDAALLDYVRTTMRSRDAAEIEAFRDRLLHDAAPEDEHCTLFEQLRGSPYAGTTVDNFAKAIAADEGVAVPERTGRRSPRASGEPSA